MSFRYRAYGLNILSELSCDYLAEASFSKPDVRIVLGDTPPKLGPEAFIGPKFEVEGRRILVKTYTIADFLVSDGQSIQVSLKPKARLNEVQNLLFGAVWGGLLLQRQHLALHASALTHNGRALLICADSGVGKSSFAFHLARRGYRLLDDNIAVLGPAKDRIWIPPGRSQMKMWAKNLEPFKTELEQPLCRCFLDLDKFEVPVGEKERQTEPTSLQVAYLLTRTQQFQIRTLAGGEALNHVRRHVFANKFLPGMDEEGFLFKQIVQAVNTFELRLVETPPGKFQESWVEQVQKDFEQGNKS